MLEEKIYHDLKQADCNYYETDAEKNEYANPVFMSCAMHTHNYNELCIVTQGDSKIISPSSISHLEGCFLIFYPAYLPHMQINRLENGYRRYLIRYGSNLVNSAFLTPVAYSFVTGASDVISLALDKNACETLLPAVSLFNRLCKDKHSQNNAQNRALILSVILNIVSDAINECGGLEIKSSRYAYIGKVLSHISENYEKKMSASILADKFYVSRAKLMNDFRRITGETLADYITKVRLEHAAILLCGSESLSEISEKCGFSSVSYFVNRFGRVYGTTPLKYRKNKTLYNFDKSFGGE